MRLELPVQTGLRLHADPPGYAPPASQLANRARTVGIEFADRLLVWHEIPSTPAKPPFPEFSYNPTITVVFDGEDDRNSAANDLLRFVSALVFHYELFIHPVLPFFLSGSGDMNPFHRPMRTDLRSFVNTWDESAPARIEADAEAGLALAVYREGVNATSPYFGFFAFWSVLDAVFDGKSKRVDAFVNGAADTNEGIGDYAQRILPRWTLPEDTDTATYLREHGRNAIGHVKRDRSDAPHVDPDDNQARHRLAAEAYWLRALAKRAVLERWPEPVRVIERIR